MWNTMPISGLINNPGQPIKRKLPEVYKLDFQPPPRTNSRTEQDHEVKRDLFFGQRQATKNITTTIDIPHNPDGKAYRKGDLIIRYNPRQRDQHSYLANHEAFVVARTEFQKIKTIFEQEGYDGKETIKKLVEYIMYTDCRDDVHEDIITKLIDCMKMKQSVDLIFQSCRDSAMQTDPLNASLVANNITYLAIKRVVDVYGVYALHVPAQEEEEKEEEEKEEEEKEEEEEEKEEEEKEEEDVSLPLALDEAIRTYVRSYFSPVGVVVGHPKVLQHKILSKVLRYTLLVQGRAVLPYTRGQTGDKYITIFNDWCIGTIIRHPPITQQQIDYMAATKDLYWTTPQQYSPIDKVASELNNRLCQGQQVQVWVSI